MALITGVLEILPDGRFVVTFGDNQISTLKCDLPENLADFSSLAHAFLAGVAHARLQGATATNPNVLVADSEVI